MKKTDEEIIKELEKYYCKECEGTYGDDWSCMQPTNHLIHAFKKGRKQAIKEVKVLLNNHRGKGLITCDKTCFCWDVEALLNKKELKKGKR